MWLVRALAAIVTILAMSKDSGIDNSIGISWPVEILQLQHAIHSELERVQRTLADNRIAPGRDARRDWRRIINWSTPR